MERGLVLLALALVALSAGAAAQATPGERFTFAAPSLLVGPVDLALDVEPGECVTRPLYVRNNGTTAATFRIGVIQSIGAVTPTTGGVVAPTGPQFVARVEPGAATLEPNETRELALEACAFPSAPEGPVNLSLQFMAPGGLPLGAFEVPAQVARPPAPADPSLPPATLGAAAAAVALVGAGVVAFRRVEWLRVLAFAGLAPLYTRLAPSALLEQEKRETLHHLIVQEPGIHFSALAHRTGLPNGVLVHHLRTLEKHRLIVSRRDGALRRYAAASDAFPPPPPRPVTPAQARVLELLREAPRTQGEIAAALGLSQQGANRHVKALERRGLLSIRYGEGAWRCHLSAAREGDLVANNGLPPIET